MWIITNSFKKLALAIFIASVFVPVSLAAEPVVIRMAHSASSDSPKGRMAAYFKKLMQETLGEEKVVVEVYPEGILFDDKQILPAVIKNRVQLVVTPVSRLQEFSPRFKLFDLPFLFVSERAASRFLKGEFGERLLRLTGQFDLVGLGYLNDGMKQLSSVQKIVVPKDAKNVKFLTSGSDVAEKFFRQIEARPIVANLNKIDTLLKNNVAEGQESTWSNMQTRGLAEYQPHILESNHVYIADVILASKQGWESIPADVRSVLTTQLKKAIDFGNQLAEKQSVNERALIVSSGQAEIVNLTINQRDDWIAAMEGVWKAFEDEVGAELIDAAASAR